MPGSGGSCSEMEWRATGAGIAPRENTPRFTRASLRLGPLRLDESKRELVGGNFRVAGRFLARIGGNAQEITLAFEDEARLLHFREDDGLVDAMQGFSPSDIGAGLGRLIDHDEMAAGLLCR